MGVKENMERELEELKKQRDATTLEYDKKFAYLGDEKAIEKINKVYKFEDENNKHLLIHVKRAEEILSNILSPNLEDRFFNYDDINIKWSSYIEIEEKGHWDTNSNTMTIDCQYLLNKDEFKNNFNYELLNTIQHELIHAFISHKFKQLDLMIYKDASPVHQAIITYFNSRGCYIESNGNLSDVFRTEQIELYNLAINKDMTFVKLIKELNAWQEKIKEKLIEIKKRTIYVKGFSESVTIVACFKGNNEYTQCKLNKSNKTYVFEKGECVIPLLVLELGMDCCSSKIEEKIKEYSV